MRGLELIIDFSANKHMMKFQKIVIFQQLVPIASSAHCPKAKSEARGLHTSASSIAKIGMRILPVVAPLCSASDTRGIANAYSCCNLCGARDVSLIGDLRAHQIASDRASSRRAHGPWRVSFGKRASGTSFPRELMRGGIAGSRHKQLCVASGRHIDS